MRCSPCAARRRQTKTSFVAFVRVTGTSQGRNVTVAYADRNESSCTPPSLLSLQQGGHHSLASSP
eukprot:6259325-Prymnesium_polylepis.1